MKRRIAVTLMLAMLAVSPLALAQNPPPNAGALAPVAAPPPPPARPPVEANRGASTADARNCLEFPTNPEVIKCAEKYLQRKRKG